MRFTIDEARKLLRDADIFDNEAPPQTINMNDQWSWACADCQRVPDDTVCAVAELFFRYGWCGVLYWVSERNGGMLSEFHDNNRFIEFVRREEQIRKEIPGSTKRAYHKAKYEIGTT